MRPPNKGLKRLRSASRVIDRGDKTAAVIELHYSGMKEKCQDENISLLDSRSATQCPGRIVLVAVQEHSRLVDGFLIGNEADKDRIRLISRQRRDKFAACRGIDKNLGFGNQAPNSLRISDYGEGNRAGREVAIKFNRLDNA